jgi:hypothetical protein
MNKTGIDLIAIERKEQFEKHNQTIENDIIYNNCYQLSKAAVLLISSHDINKRPDGWNKEIWEKMFNKSYKERLIIAGALIAAEIDRIQNS